MTSQLPDGCRLDNMTEADLDPVTQIESQAQITPWPRNTFADCLASPHYLSQVVRAGQQPVAFQVLSFILDECHLMNIAVLPAFQQQGLGRYLVQQAISEAKQRNASVIFLEVRASNSSAQRLYHACGFEQYSQRRDYYRSADGMEDAVLMHCLL